jgi:hypothetical protein
LQFDDRWHCVPEILYASGGPGIGPFTHGRGRRDGINGDDFA